MTDSFITQAEEALAKYEETRSLGVHAPRTKVAAIADQQQTALRSLLGEYKRLTTEGETEYRTTRTFGGGMPVHVRRESRFVTAWVPAEGEDQ